MVNLNGGSRMMVNRCIELLRARIDSAQTRYIAGRLSRPNVPYPRNLSQDQESREREKTDNYEKNKKRSMWELDDGQSNRSREQKRLDEQQYRHRGLEERSYDCTWTNFPESVVAKQKKQRRQTEMQDDSNEVTPPTRRRRTEEDRPKTAMPWDEQAAAFISQCDNNMPQLQRSRTRRLPTQSRNVEFSSPLHNLKRQFTY